jgi:hypothetical protein
MQLVAITSERWLVWFTVALVILFQLGKEGLFRRFSKGYARRLHSEAAAITGESSRSPTLIPCERGVYPPLATLLFLDVLTKGRVLIVTSSEVMLVDRYRNCPKMKDIVCRDNLDRLRILNLRGLYGKLEFGGEKLWIDRRWFSEVREIAKSR